MVALPCLLCIAWACGRLVGWVYYSLLLAKQIQMAFQPLYFLQLIVSQTPLALRFLLVSDGSFLVSTPFNLYTIGFGGTLCTGVSSPAGPQNPRNLRKLSERAGYPRCFERDHQLYTYFVRKEHRRIGTRWTAAQPLWRSALCVSQPGRWRKVTILWCHLSLPHTILKNHQKSPKILKVQCHTAKVQTSDQNSAAALISFDAARKQRISYPCQKLVIL